MRDKMIRMPSDVTPTRRLQDRHTFPRFFVIFIAAFAMAGIGCGDSSSSDDDSADGGLISDASMTEDAGITDSDAGITDGGTGDDCPPRAFWR